jgi:hypothetical protein
MRTPRTPRSRQDFDVYRGVGRRISHLAIFRRRKSGPVRFFRGEAMKGRAEQDKETRNRAKKFEALQTAKKKKGPNTP